MKTNFQSLTAAINLNQSAKRSNQCTNVAFPLLLVSQKTLSYRTLGYLKIFSIQALDRSDILATPGHRANPSGRESTGSAIWLIQVALVPVGRQADDSKCGVSTPLPRELVTDLLRQKKITPRQKELARKHSGNVFVAESSSEK